ncbi:hypothetical protein HZH68_000691 [Vespula germanica]|uniref:Uncharacterized protein n=1 Tax=Vespula germanica TaxID=30212 RepID=A0A834U681_VESGE|nr:hypothetical protein HZH68_000691 [Vespula germanica]
MRPCLGRVLKRETEKKGYDDVGRNGDKDENEDENDDDDDDDDDDNDDDNDDDDDEEEKENAKICQLQRGLRSSFEF